MFGQARTTLNVNSISISFSIKFIIFHIQISSNPYFMIYIIGTLILRRQSSGGLGGEGVGVAAGQGRRSGEEENLIDGHITIQLRCHVTLLISCGKSKWSSINYVSVPF